MMNIQELLDNNDHTEYKDSYKKIIMDQNDKIEAGISVIKEYNEYEKNTYYTYSITVRYIGYPVITPIFKIHSKTFNLSFIVEIFNYYKPIINEIMNDTNKLNFIDKVIVSESIINKVAVRNNHVDKSDFDFIKPAENFLKKNNNAVFTEDMIYQYLLLVSGLYSKTDDVSELVSEHKEYFKDYTDLLDKKNYYDFVKFLYPAYYYLPNKDIYINLYRNFPFANSLESLQTFNKLVVLSCEGFDSTTFENMKVRDFNVHLSEVNNSGFTKYNNYLEKLTKSLSSKEFLDYVNDLTIKEFKDLFATIKNENLKSCNNNEMLLHCKFFMEDKDFSYPDMDYAKDVLNNKFYDKTKKEFRTFYTYGLKYHGAGYKHKAYKKYMIDTVNDYLLNYVDDNLTISQLINLYDVVNHRNKWITNNDLSEWLFKELSKTLNSKEIIELLSDVITNKVKLTPVKWQKYLNNIDEYKTMPVSWWLELM